MTVESTTESHSTVSVADAASEAWTRFSASENTDAFWTNWLNLLCLQLEQVRAGCVLLQAESQESFGVAAVWPESSRDIQYLAATAERSLTERRGVVVSTDGNSAPTAGQEAFAGYPVIVDGQLKGAVVLHLGPRSVASLQDALRKIHWGTAWLGNRFYRDELAEKQSRIERLTSVTAIAAVAMDNKASKQSALAMINEMAAMLNCTRVSIGFEFAGAIELQAISHTASFDKKMGMVRLLTNAMEEVLDLAIPLGFPPTDDGLDVIAHARLAADADVESILSVPLVDEGAVMGVLVLERKVGRFDEDEFLLCETLGMLLGPLFALKFHDELSLYRRAKIAVVSGLQNLFGPRHPGLKLAVTLGVALLAFLSFATSEYRLSADTVIEGSIQRAIVAPFEGYIVESLVRAGDTVEQDQVLSRLDDRDLTLEQIKWTSERLQLKGRQRQAMAEQNNADMAIIAAQIRQVEAQVNLVNERLNRSVLVAPFDGVVVSGDLSQLLGTPVEQGDTLFEIALLDAYRVILKVDERDIAEIRVGHSGQLAMYSLPDEFLPFVVKHITPISTPEGGRNYFRVEAEISAATGRLRPGMEGVGIVEVGDRRLIWIWTHRFVDWLRLWLWNWEP
jgi:multidrug resistance efflux pump